MKTHKKHKKYKIHKNFTKKNFIKIMKRTNNRNSQS